MTHLQALNRKMLAIEKQGHLTEQEYATYRQLLEAVEVLAVLLDHTLHYATMPHAHSDAHRDAAKARAVLRKLK